MYSGGLGSWATGDRLVSGGVPVTDVLFADTFIEDDDLYRFLVEGATDLLGLPQKVGQSLAPMWGTIPPLEAMADRKAHLSALALAAMALLPGLRWIQEGREPWEVFRDHHAIGNSRWAFCSHELKQDACREWLTTNCQPDDAALYVGIDWTEKHRYEGGKSKPGTRERWLPWKCFAPLCDEPYLSKYEIVASLERKGIDPPHLYDLGFVHNNCGGFCVKAGQAHFRQLLQTMPERYAYHEGREQELREFIGKDVSILRDRTGGKTMPLTLVDFRHRIEDGQKCDLLDWGGCGCFSEAVG